MSPILTVMPPSPSPSSSFSIPVLPTVSCLECEPTNAGKSMTYVRRHEPLKDVIAPGRPLPRASHPIRLIGVRFFLRPLGI